MVNTVKVEFFNGTLFLTHLMTTFSLPDSSCQISHLMQ